jgi:hypothetical protein
LNKKTKKETQIKVHKTTAIPTLTYSSETWTMTKEAEAKKKQQV